MFYSFFDLSFIGFILFNSSNLNDNSKKNNVRLKLKVSHLRLFICVFLTFTELKLH